MATFYVARSEIITPLPWQTFALPFSLRIGGVNHDAGAVTVPSLAPTPVYSSWALNPADGTPWSTPSLPPEVGIVST